MKIAIISDVHGNYPALVRVVDDAISNKVDKFIFLGDYIFDLPFPNEVARFLMKMENSYIIKGNKETHMAMLANEDQEKWIHKQFGGIYQTFRELAPDVYNFLNGLDEECYINLSHDISIYAVHFPLVKPLSITNLSSSNYHKKMLEKPFTHEQFLLDFSDMVNSDECKAAIDKIDANIILFGHNHLQSHAYCEDKLIINPGSCGQPLDFNNAAAYTILEVMGNELNVIEKRVAYDIESVIKQAKESLLYEKGKVWTDLVCLALKMGRDYFGIFFEIAGQIASSKNEEGLFFSDSTWEEAADVFMDKYKDIEDL